MTTCSSVPTASLHVVDDNADGTDYRIVGVADIQQLATSSQVTPTGSDLLLHTHTHTHTHTYTHTHTRTHAHTHTHTHVHMHTHTHTHTHTQHAEFLSMISYSHCSQWIIGSHQ